MHRSQFFPLLNTKGDVAFVSNVSWIGFLGHDPAICSCVCLNPGFRGNFSDALSECHHFQKPQLTTFSHLVRHKLFFSKKKNILKTLTNKIQVLFLGYYLWNITSSWQRSQAVVNWHGSITDPLSLKWVAIGNQMVQWFRALTFCRLFV